MYSGRGFVRFGCESLNCIELFYRYHNIYGPPGNVAILFRSFKLYAKYSAISSGINQCLTVCKLNIRFVPGNF